MVAAVPGQSLLTSTCPFWGQLDCRHHPHHPVGPGRPCFCGPATHLACPLLALVTFPPAATRWLSGHPTSSRVPVDGPGPWQACLLPHMSLWSQVNVPSLQERGLDLPSEVDGGHSLSVRPEHHLLLCLGPHHRIPPPWPPRPALRWSHLCPRPCGSSGLFRWSRLAVLEAGWLAPGLPTHLVQCESRLRPLQGDRSPRVHPAASSPGLQIRGCACLLRPIW